MGSSASGLHTLRRRSDYLRLRNGASRRRHSVVVQALKSNRDEGIGVGFTATRKVGSATVRNRSKRRLREAARQLLPRLGIPGVDYVFIARRDTATICWQRLLDDMEIALISLADHFTGSPKQQAT